MDQFSEARDSDKKKRLGLYSNDGRCDRWTPGFRRAWIGKAFSSGQLLDVEIRFTLPRVFKPVRMF
jgi:hypothetical protein